MESVLKEQSFENVIDAVPAFIGVTGPDGRVEYSNRPLLEYVGLTLEDVRGEGYLATFHPDDVGAFSSAFAAARDASTPFEMEARLRRADGVFRWFLVRAAPVHDCEGRVVRWYGTTTDIDERKQAEERLRLRFKLGGLLTAKLEFTELLIGLAGVLKEHIAYRDALLAVADKNSAKLRLYPTSLQGTHYLEPGTECALEQVPGAAALEGGQTIVLRENVAGAFSAGPLTAWVASGTTALCVVALRAAKARTGGMLLVSSDRLEGFTPRELQLLSDLAVPLGIASDNAWAYQQISELNDRLAREKLYLEGEIELEHNFGEIVGSSRTLKGTLREVERVAPTDATVLLLGETGTGKELLARALHRLSARRDQPFVRINCAAIPATLLESELFGYERGAFTGAVTSRIGRFELANRGTLFLDEVGDIPLEVQPKLLRAIQEREFERLGGTRTHRLDVRLIAATNRDLGAMVADGTFRRDLYYRLNVVPIRVPSLRERREDIPDLVRFFVRKYARDLNRRIETVPSSAITALQDWQWPGNIRELENVIERAVILSSGPGLEIGPLRDLARPSAAPAGGSSTLAEAERRAILKALRESNGIVAGPRGAASRLGIKRTTLQSKMRRLGIRPERRHGDGVKF